MRIKKIYSTAILLIIFTSSCTSIINLKNIFKGRISVQQVIEKKEEIDKSDNPALDFLIIKELKEKRVKIENVVVKDVVSSGNIDYTFCVIVTVPTDRGNIDCYVYAGDIYPREDLETISQLQKGKTKIEVDGDFNRFFTLLDESYTKIEIVKAIITIIEDD